MPSTLLTATVSPASTVLPAALYTAFTRTEIYPLMSNTYHDGQVERSLITDTVNPARSCRTWQLSRRLTTAQLATLLAFWESTVYGGLLPFYFYDPFDVAPGQQIGSNYDPTGTSTQGRATCFFRGDWRQSTEIGRSVVPDLLLVEVA